MITCALDAPSVKPSIWLDHLSFSSIKTYQACPKKFAFKYIELVPEEFTPSYFSFGGAFHRAVERIHESTIAGEPVPGLDELVDAFDRAWTDLVAERSPVKFSKDEDAGSLRQLATRMLSAYREHLLVSPNRGSQIIAIEESVRFRLLADVPPIEMRLDLLELRGTDLIVSDLKTSKSRWSEAKIADGLPQLVLYAHGLMPILRELGATRIVPRFVTVTKAKKPVVQVLQPTATQADVTRLKQTVAETWNAIQSDVFPRYESWACAQCPYQRRCLGR
jgi:RecB family exonuclease